MPLQLSCGGLWPHFSGNMQPDTTFPTQCGLNICGAFMDYYIPCMQIWSILGSAFIHTFANSLYPVHTNLEYPRPCIHSYICQHPCYGKLSLDHHPITDIIMVAWIGPPLIAWGGSQDPLHEWPRHSKAKSCKSIYCFHLKNNDPIRPQFCTCHSSWAAVACAKYWPECVIFHIQNQHE